MAKILNSDAHGMTVATKQDVNEVVNRILKPTQTETRQAVEKIKAAFANL